MRNTQESGQILRSKKRPRRTLRSGRGSRTNSNTSRQIPARVIDAAYDARPATDFCAETPTQPSIGPLTTDLKPSGRPFPPFLELIAGQRSRDELQVNRFGHHDVQAPRYWFSCCSICQHIS